MVLCAPGLQACNGACFDTAVFSCVSGKLVPATTGSGPTSTTGSTTTTDSGVPSSSTTVAPSTTSSTTTVPPPATSTTTAQTSTTAVTTSTAAQTSTTATTTRTRVVPTLTPLAITGLVANSCEADNSAVAISCPDGRVAQVQKVFFGRDEPDIPDASCPGPAPVFNCSLSARDTAAVTALFAAQCDGKQSCSPSLSLADVARLFGSPCPQGTAKALRVSYACRDLHLDPMATPVQISTSDSLRLIRPGTLASPKCPKFVSLFEDAFNSASALQMKLAPPPASAPFARLSIFKADLNATDLDSMVRSATDGKHTLDTVAELNITAFNFDLGSAITVIGRNHTGFTRVRVEAHSIISDGGVLDIHSMGPDEAGNFGPEVVVRAARTFGPVKVMQNGLPSAPEPTVTTTYLTQLVDPQFAFSPFTYRFLGDWQCRNTSGQFQPICFEPNPTFNCVSSGQSNLVNCTSGPWTFTDFFGATILNQRQNDSSDILPGYNQPAWRLQMQTDRFIYPEPSAGWHDIGGKSKLYGSIASSAKGFFDRTGLVWADVAGNGVGIMATGDYAFKLGRHPLEGPMTQGNPNNWPANYIGLMALMGGPSSAVSEAAPVWLHGGDNFWDKFEVASEQAANGIAHWSADGTIDFKPARTDPLAPVDATVSRFAAGCADEMVAAGRLTDAMAFLTDVAPGLPSSVPDVAVGRVFSVLADLQNSRAGEAVQAVPFLSAATIETAAAAELQAMANLEASLKSLFAQGTTADAAITLLQASNSTIQAAVDAASTELEGDISHLEMLQEAFDKIDETYQERSEGLEAKKSAFEDGVKKYEAAEIAELVVEFLAAIATCVATEGAGFASLMEVSSKAGGKIADIIKNLSKFAEALEGIAKMFEGVESLVSNIIGLVEKIKSAPKEPKIDVGPAEVGAATDSNSTLASLSSSLLNFQDLKDQATIYLGPAISKGIDGASDYALALQMLANAGIDRVGLQTQLLSAQVKVVQSGVKLQAAQEAQARIADLIVAAQASGDALAPAVREILLNLLERKMRTLDLVYQIGQAYSFARTAFTHAGLVPDPSSSVADFTAAVNGAIQALDNQAAMSQPVCNSSWIHMDPTFISDLSAHGTAFLDLRDPTLPALRNHFGGLDDVHMLQINLKPYGIQFVGDAAPGDTPILQLDIKPTGEYRNTLTLPTGARYIEDFLATPWTYAMQVEPTNGWHVTVPGALTSDASARYYVPSVFGKFRISPSANMDPNDWDWSGVWGVQVEISGFAVRAGASNAAAGVAGLAACSALSRNALALVTPKMVVAPH
ncbi:hypothetical protein DFJ74DRAFT_665067 [Hyaloraphidium curvatum]|nr:hypothetical protein DFJ74DRAFT_665067 [Hyaloraphidium curvatum]